MSLTLASYISSPPDVDEVHSTMLIDVPLPSLSDGSLEGISDVDDPLKFDVCMPGGPDQYVAWFIEMARARNKAQAST